MRDNPDQYAAYITLTKRKIKTRHEPRPMRVKVAKIKPRNERQRQKYRRLGITIGVLNFHGKLEYAILLV